MRTAATGLLLTALICSLASAQELSPKQTIGITATYAPTSSAILIGSAQQRKTWISGFEYDRRLGSTPGITWNYMGSFAPFFQESDPALVGTTDGQKVDPSRVIGEDHTPVGYQYSGIGPGVPIYAVYARERTYAVALSPIGIRINLLTKFPIQPTFSVDAGFVVSSRDIPIDSASRFNYTFSFGPGVQVFFAGNTQARIEGIYRHLSNANSGQVNPGIDQYAVRLTLSRRLGSR